MTTEIVRVQCPICDAADKWLSVDEYRAKPAGMKLCTGCGFVTFPDIVAKNDELKEFYRKEYRPGPSVQNLFTGQRKLHYHAHFLDELFKQWQKEDRAPEVFEIGSAFGMFLNMMKTTFPKASVAGSELTLSFRRVCFHEYGIQLAEEFDDSRQYDLIATYKVLEHQAFPDRELRRYAKALKPDGYLYISVPTWFHTMSNFGMDGFTMDYYYDKNHINVWTRKLFESLLAKCGLEVVKSNYVFYDSTYLCRRNDKLAEEFGSRQLSKTYESSTEIISKLAAIKKAAEAFDAGEFDAAMKIFPAYPDAILANYEKNRAQYHQGGWEKIQKEVLDPALAACPNSHRITFFCAEVNARYDRFNEALELLQRCLDQKPGDPAALMLIGNCYRSLAKLNPAQSAHLHEQARDAMRELNRVSMQSGHEAINWMFADNAQIPMPGEGGIAAA